MKKIPLTQGLFAMVSDCDFEALNVHKWCAVKLNGRFYATRKVNGKQLLMHRSILGLKSPKILCDHRNGNGLDNTRENIRNANHSQNNHNKGKQSNNTSGFKGVSFVKVSNKWRADIKVNGQGNYLGCFETPEEAAKAYDNAAKRLHGDFAQLNNVNHGRIS